MESPVRKSRRGAGCFSGGGPFRAGLIEFSYLNFIEPYNIDVADDVLAQDTTMGQKAGMT